jgi:hypothetical protein
MGKTRRRWRWAAWAASREGRLGLKPFRPRGGQRSRNWQPRGDGPNLDDMTINIGLVTSDAVILGCDSVASTTSNFINPFDMNWEADPSGEAGAFRIKFSFSDFKSIVTNAWGGVTKIFEIHPPPTPVVAVTAGLAKLNDRPIASVARDFYVPHQRRNKHLVQVEVIARQFLEFMRKEYAQHYHGSNLPDQLKEGPEFLVGGYGRDDDFATIYRLNVQQNTITEEFGPVGRHGRTGLAWNGQSDAVERFIRGYNYEARLTIDGTIGKRLKDFNTNNTKYVTETINDILGKLAQPMPSGITISVPELPKIDLDWDDFRIDLDYANLPLQEAVNFVAFLVKLQGGRSRFARGVPTVGGRTHIGVITKDKGLRMLNEPELTHRDTGFSDDQ